MHILNSSVRVTSAVDTIRKAEKISRKLGITRVTDITRLDFLGMPVFASIRPTGKVLCVHNGKGVLAEEAKAGAYMEAIEFACADPENSSVKWDKASYQEIIDDLPDGVKLTDFCFRVNRSCNPISEVIYVTAKDILTGDDIKLPEELFFLPSLTPKEDIVFGFSTNGLASGNTLLEATIHAVCELIERDTMSFDKVEDKSYFIDPLDLTDDLKSLYEKVENSGLSLCLRYLKNEFDIPVFKAYIFEKSSENYCSAAHGCGAHPIKSIAAARAITEAIQSRLTAIHGGRDDLVDQYIKYSNLSPSDKEYYYDKLKLLHFSKDNSLKYQEIKCESGNIFSIESLWMVIEKKLKINGFKNIYRVIHYESSDFAIVKIVIPKMEHFEAYAKRIGPRLWEKLQLKKL
ncbi:YcaO-like family protein [Acinetobacter venetianus]|uniref:YcaO-like family protein n=1 Tax=Acinetobacter venetianus TaxID=52133 RepID=A0A150HWS3_9GAMM|nr:YcaO-like family protein [Acinetobacter venetianus]KXZ71492.1 YcaO-like family protein [Acinetobacter venetianus]